MGGGIDSTAAAMMLNLDGFDVQGIHFSYGQRANAGEVKATHSLASFLGIALSNQVLRFPRATRGNELLARNALFVLAACPLAFKTRRMLVLGIHSGTDYYDCSGPFVWHMQRILDGYFGGSVQLVAPLADWSKAQIVDWGRSHGLPFSTTFSCQTGPSSACGVCPSCLMRKELKVDE